MKLHLGSGSKHIEGFINIDARELPGVDEVDNIETLSKYESNSVDLIYVSHVLEHISRLNYKKVLERWFEILKPNGIIRISVPDFAQVVKHYEEFGQLEKLLGFLYGGQNYNENFHYMGWDFRTLLFALESVGFSDIKRYDWRTTEHANIDDYSQCYLPHMDKENGMLMSLNVEATKI